MKYLLLLAVLPGQETDAERANKLLAERKFTEAIPALTKIADRDANAAWAHVSIGYAWTELKDYDKAAKAFSDAEAIEPGNAYLPFNRGRMRAIQGKLDDARRDFEASMERFPTTYPHWVRYWMGVVALPSDPAKALDWFEQARQKNPNEVEAEPYYWRNVGLCNVNLGRWERAARVYDDGLAKFPGDPWLLHLRAICHLRLGEGEKAREVGRLAEASLRAKIDHVTQFHPPFRGAWKVVQGNDGVHTHWGLASKYAWDFALTDEKGETAKPNPTRLEDYFAWDAEALAPADGVVAIAVDKYDDHLNSPGTDPGEGNHVLLEHAPKEFSAIFHLKKGSVAVKAGAKVKRGDVLGRVGSSGYSLVPHIHYVVLEDARDWLCRPSKFAHTAVELPKLGDVVRHEKE
jgi:tetratricopeptide (TPR) repeat protein